MIAGINGFIDIAGCLREICKQAVGARQGSRQVQFRVPLDGDTSLTWKWGAGSRGNVLGVAIYLAVIGEAVGHITCNWRWIRGDSENRQVL